MIWLPTEMQHFTDVCLEEIHDSVTKTTRVPGC